MFQLLSFIRGAYTNQDSSMMEWLQHRGYRLKLPRLQGGYGMIRPHQENAEYISIGEGSLQEQIAFIDEAFNFYGKKLLAQNLSISVLGIQPHSSETNCLAQMGHVAIYKNWLTKQDRIAVVKQSMNFAYSRLLICNPISPHFNEKTRVLKNQSWKLTKERRKLALVKRLDNIKEIKRKARDQAKEIINDKRKELDRQLSLRRCKIIQDIKRAKGSF